MARHRERTESAQVTSVFEREKAERYDDEEDGLFVDVPAEQERCVAAQCQCSYEVVPGRANEELYKRDLQGSVTFLQGASAGTYDLK